MDRTPVIAIASGAALVIAGLALATVAPSPGAVVTVAGIVLLAGYLVYVYRRAWSGDQKRAWDPGSLRREDRAEHDREAGVIAEGDTTKDASP